MCHSVCSAGGQCLCPFGCGRTEAIVAQAIRFELHGKAFSRQIEAFAETFVSDRSNTIIHRTSKNNSKLLPDDGMFGVL